MFKSVGGYDLEQFPTSKDQVSFDVGSYWLLLHWCCKSFYSIRNFKNLTFHSLPSFEINCLTVRNSETCYLTTSKLRNSFDARMNFVSIPPNLDTRVSLGSILQTLGIHIGQVKLSFASSLTFRNVKCSFKVELLDSTLKLHYDKFKTHKWVVRFLQVEWSSSSDPSFLFEAHSFPTLRFALVSFAALRLTNGLLDSNLLDLLCNCAHFENSIFVHKVAFMVRQDVVLVSGNLVAKP